MGGGHGAYSVATALKNPPLKITIFESEYSKDIAEANIRKQGLEGRVDFASGDYLKDQFPGKHDAFFLFNIIHQHSEEENLILLKRYVTPSIPGAFYLSLIHSERKR